MGLTEDYYKQLLYEQIKQKNEDALSSLPKEFRFANERVSITPDIRSLLCEFLTLIPNDSWKCFPDNYKPKVRVENKEDFSISIKYRIMGSAHVNCYAQIMSDDMIPRSVQLQHIYKKTYEGDELYSWGFQKKRIEKKINDECLSKEKQLNSEFALFKDNYYELIKNYGNGLSQKFIQLRYYSDSEYSRNGYIVIFSDGNLYNWKVEGIGEEKISHSINFDSYYPFKTADTAKSFFLKQLNIMKNSNI